MFSMQHSSEQELNNFFCIFGGFHVEFMLSVKHDHGMFHSRVKPYAADYYVDMMLF